MNYNYIYLFNLVIKLLNPLPCIEYSDFISFSFCLNPRNSIINIINKKKYYPLNGSGTIRDFKTPQNNLDDNFRLDKI